MCLENPVNTTTSCSAKEVLTRSVVIDIESSARLYTQQLQASRWLGTDGCACLYRVNVPTGASAAARLRAAPGDPARVHALTPCWNRGFRRYARIRGPRSCSFPQVRR